MDRKYSLRCVFKYEDGRIWRGMWDKSGTALSDMAAGQTLEGMAEAVIEAKNLETKSIMEVASCASHLFDKFQWRAVARTAMGVKGSHTVQGTVVGLTIQTKNERVTAFIDGTTQIDGV